MIRDENAGWILSILEAFTAKIDISIRYEALEDNQGELRLRSGVCRLRGRSIMFVDSRLSEKGKCEAIVESLKGRDFSGIFVPPLLRQLLDC